MLTAYDKPCIKLSHTADAPAAWLKALTSGLEEEMIPFEITTVAPAPIADMAFAAAESSRLEVGLALNAQEAAVHFAKLPPEKPLFWLQGGECREESLLKLGANAARLVKGVPFKEV